MKGEGSPEAHELPLLARDILYEIDMFNLAVLRITQRIDHDAWVEVLGVHTRNLIGFFGNKRRLDDVIVSDYIPTWKEPDEVMKARKWLEERFDGEMNKRLFHLTAYRRRVAPAEDAQLIMDFQRNMKTLVNYFLDQLTADRREWFGLASSGGGEA